MNRRHWLRLLIGGVVAGPLVGKLASVAPLARTTAAGHFPVTGAGFKPWPIVGIRQGELISFDADGFTINRPPFSVKSERS